MNTLQAKIAKNNYRKLKIRNTIYVLLAIFAFLFMAYGEAH